MPARRSPRVPADSYGVRGGPAGLVHRAAQHGRTALPPLFLAAVAAIGNRPCG
jgi:hypothetical protein